MPFALLAGLALVSAQAPDAGARPTSFIAPLVRQDDSLDAGGRRGSALIGPGAPADGGVDALLGTRAGPLPDHLDARTVVQGSLSKEEIRAAIQKRSSDVRRCYENALQRDGPSTEGKVKVAFTIGVDGKVTEASVVEASPQFSEPFKTCVVAAMKKLTTSPPLGGGIVKVVYPFIFKPG